ncbi:MAG: cobalt-precorrin-5B (C(1))-methyltransferase CbiD [Lachnospiraceae bacterium]|nr:cobalt-precorrin-5B (C(1))-methyltransferase CbiD [Lachnospiraceae bacterium]
MRHGYTTGSCAAAAAKAAAYMLLSGKRKDNITISTPKGIDYTTAIVDTDITDSEVSCGVIKDSGDDPDITNGIKICARVAYAQNCDTSVIIKGGQGVGTVTSPGLDRPVGDAAINSVPRMMIENEVSQVMDLFDHEGSLEVTIFVPEGEEIAKKTYNERLGIVGGISIIGTSGIVEPMSTKAIKDTIRLEIRQQVAMGHKNIIVSPGNYGLDFIKNRLGYDLDNAVKCSNFIGDTLEMAMTEGAEKLLLVGHMGKLVKLAGGIMNTHSKEADCRMELMTAIFLKAGGSKEGALKILECLNTTQAYEYVKAEKKEKEFARVLMGRCRKYLDAKTCGKLKTECIIFSNEDGIIGKSEEADELLAEIKNEYQR